MKKILMLLATLIPSATSAFVKNTNNSEVISTINNPTNNQFKIEFDPDPLVGATYKNEIKGGTTSNNKDIILLFEVI